MARLTCPYCYHRQQAVHLLHVCVGQGSPGFQSCAPVQDADREQFTGFNGRSMPVFKALRLEDDRGLCPLDGSWSARRACQRCHTPLPSTLVARPSPLIGLVGDTQSGKTVYLTVLNRLLRDVVARRFDADVHLVGEQQAGSNSIHEWLTEHEQALFVEGHLPGLTPPSPFGRRVPLVLQWRHPQRTRLGKIVHPPTLLSFCDVAGEDPSQADRQRYLQAADGLMVLLDAYQLPGVRSAVELPPNDPGPKAVVDAVLGVITEAIEAGGRHGDKITTPVAVVLTKLDVIEPLLEPGHFLLRARPRAEAGYDEQFGANMHEHVRSLLHDRKAGGIDRFFAANFATYRYFAVSALGALPDYDGGDVAPSGVHPRNVVEPLLWLMHLKKIIRQVPRG